VHRRGGSEGPLPDENQKQQLYFEDLRVGQNFTSRTYKLTENEITEFASRYDPQPFHLDAELAKTTLFRGLAASGWHTASVTMRLLVGHIPIAGGIVGGGGIIAWPKPARPGDVLVASSEIVSSRDSDSNACVGLIELKSETHNQRAHCVLRQRVTLIVARRKTSPGEAVD
jgi:acyl dehydratase